MKLIPCIILCGGVGSRLSKVVKDVPKCLAPINGIPFLFYKIKYLERVGISEVFLSIGYLGNKIKKFIESLDTSINIIIVDEGKNLLGTGGAAKKSYQLINGPAFLTYGDTFLDVSYADVYKKYQLTKNPLMTIFKNNKKYDTSNVLLNGNKILYKKKNPNPDSQYIDYGLSIFSTKDFINTEDIFDLSVLHESFSIEEKLEYFEVKNRFYEIGTPQSLAETELYLTSYEFK
jgi:MurNAc alpha-1-phosphate uridylyltransferase